ncbi:MAG: DUF2807 domain-containing protein [Planctomycetes bacterium]|nr:DUF2807 domain-containing protein [Planctomycetota bacterium]
MSRIYLTGLLVLVLLQMNCHVKGGCINSVEGNGNIIEEHRQAVNFSKIDARGSYSIRVICKKDYNLSIETDDNLLPYIVTKTSGDTLLISTKDNYNLKPTNSIKVEIGLPELASVATAGGSNITISDLDTKAFQLDSRGSSNITLNGTADKFSASIAGSVRFVSSITTQEISINARGSADVELSGTTDKLSFEVAGSGTLKADTFTSNTASISIRGSGRVNVKATESLDVNIAGSGDVIYHGRPLKINQSIKGAGSIKSALD